jgi:hypothetical protein
LTQQLKNKMSLNFSPTARPNDVKAQHRLTMRQIQHLGLRYDLMQEILTYACPTLSPNESPTMGLQENVLDVRQSLVIADIGTKALSEAQFVKLRDMMNGNQWEDNQREYVESNYSFLMFNVTDNGYESEGEESKQEIEPEQSHGQSVNEDTSSVDESNSIANSSSTSSVWRYLGPLVYGPLVF